MAKYRCTWECPVWGPGDSHYYADEETGEYRPFCECGQIDPGWQDPDRVTRISGVDYSEPPF